MLLELVLLILQNLYNDDKHAFLVCLRVCKAWHDLGVPILWQNIYLDGPTTRTGNQSKLSLFIEPQPPLELCNRVQSLTCCVTAPIYIERRFDHIVLIAQCLVHLKQLKSFSGFLEIKPTYIQRREFQTFIQAVPTTLRHLELRLGGTGPNNSHIEDKCQHFKPLSALLPQLQSFRLEGCRTCPGVFEHMKEPCSHLTHISIEFHSDTSRCSCEMTKAQHEQIGFQELNNDKALEKIQLAARHVVDAGLFPSIKKFSFIGEINNIHRDRPAANILYHADILQQTVVAYPIRRALASKSWMRYKSPANGVEEDLIASRNLLHMIENSNWKSFKSGIRLPSTMSKPDYLHPEAKDDIIRTAAGDWTIWRQMFPRRSAFALLFWESRSGRPLLHVETTDELKVPRQLDRERPDEERSMQKDSELAKELLQFRQD